MLSDKHARSDIWSLCSAVMVISDKNISEFGHEWIPASHSTDYIVGNTLAHYSPKQEKAHAHSVVQLCCCFSWASLTTNIHTEESIYPSCCLKQVLFGGWKGSSGWRVTPDSSEDPSSVPGHTLDGMELPETPDPGIQLAPWLPWALLCMWHTYPLNK